MRKETEAGQDEGNWENEQGEQNKDFSPEQIAQLRDRILEQLKALPPEKADELREQIESMPDEQFIDFLKKNRMIQTGGGSEGESGGCIFCLIVQRNVETSKIYEDSEVVSVLDINPVSKGHILVIPKEHIQKTEELKASMFEKARMLSSLIKKELKADSIEILTSSRLGHAIINIIPIYKDMPLLDFKRQKASGADIKSIANKLEIALKDKEQLDEENKVNEQKARLSEEVKNIRIKRRIP